LVSTTQSANVQSQEALLLQSASCIIDDYATTTGTFPSVFHGFIYGIRATGSYMSAGLTVSDTEFRCYRGCVAQQIASGSNIVGCDFYPLNTANSISVEVPPTFDTNPSPTNSNPWINPPVSNNWSTGPSYGVYLDACGSTTVRDSYFAISGSPDVQRTGVYVNSCDFSYVNINKNEFRDNTYGCRFFNDNRSNTPTFNGTVFQCNNFLNNYRHVEISAESPNSTNVGINQNICVNANVSFSNIFYNNSMINGSSNTLFTQGRFIWDNVSAYHQFKGRPNEVGFIFNQIQGPNPPTLGVSYSPSIQVNPNCGSNSSNGSFQTLYEEILEKREVLNNYKDDSAPIYYKYLIETTNSSNILSRYNELSSVSPALSVERIMEVLDMESEIPRPLLLDILKNNISSLKNGDALAKIDSLSVPLTTWERYSLYASILNIDAKEILEIELQTSFQAVYSKINDELFVALLDSNFLYKEEAQDVFRNRLALLTEGNSLILEAEDQMLWSELSDIVSGRLESLREDMTEYKDLATLLLLVEEAQQKGVNYDVMQSNYDSFAESYLLRDLPLTYRMASIIENKFGSEGFHGDLDYPEGLPKYRSLHSSEIYKTDYSISIFPNPAVNYVRVQSTEIELDSSSFVLRDVMGRVCELLIVSKTRNEVFFDLSSLTAGSYSLEGYNQGNNIFTEQIIITR
jgi:hypothetical protein